MISLTTADIKVTIARSLELMEQNKLLQTLLCLSWSSEGSSTEDIAYLQPFATT